MLSVKFKVTFSLIKVIVLSKETPRLVWRAVYPTAYRTSFLRTQDRAVESSIAFEDRDKFPVNVNENHRKVNETS